MDTAVKKTTKKTVRKPIKKKKTLWEVVQELQKKPLIRVLDEDLVYGTNMMTKLMQEK